MFAKNAVMPMKRKSGQKNARSGVNRISSAVRTYVRVEGEKLIIPLMHKPVPDFNGIDIEFKTEQAQNKQLLICFFDMEQRPSRHCLMPGP